MSDLVKQWKEAARRDDLFDHMVPSDVRQLIGEIERLRAALELAEEAVKMLIRTSDIELEHRRRAFTMLDRARAGGSPKCDTEKG